MVLIARCRSPVDCSSRSQSLMPTHTARSSSLRHATQSTVRYPPSRAVGTLLEGSLARAPTARAAPSARRAQRLVSASHACGGARSAALAATSASLTRGTLRTTAPSRPRRSRATRRTRTRRASARATATTPRPAPWPVSAVASMSSACTRCCLLTRSVAFTSVVPSLLITFSLTFRLTKASTARCRCRASCASLAECRRLLAVAREGGEVREVVRVVGAVGEYLILQLPRH